MISAESVLAINNLLGKKHGTDPRGVEITLWEETRNGTVGVEVSAYMLLRKFEYD